MKKEITDNSTSSWKDITYAITQLSKVYGGLALFVILLTVPTKAIWLLVCTLWNMF